MRALVRSGEGSGEFCRWLLPSAGVRQNTPSPLWGSTVFSVQTVLGLISSCSAGRLTPDASRASGLHSSSSSEPELFEFKRIFKNGNKSSTNVTKSLNSQMCEYLLLTRPVKQRPSVWHFRARCYLLMMLTANGTRGAFQYIQIMNNYLWTGRRPRMSQKPSPYLMWSYSKEWNIGPRAEEEVPTFVPQKYCQRKFHLWLFLEAKRLIQLCVIQRSFGLNCSENFPVHTTVFSPWNNPGIKSSCS